MYQAKWKDFINNKKKKYIFFSYFSWVERRIYAIQNNYKTIMRAKLLFYSIKIVTSVKLTVEGIKYK